MDVKTLHVTIDAEGQEVFNFLSQIENLPRWAIGFCRRVEPAGDHWRVYTPGGEILFKLEAEPKTGVIDFFGGPDPEQLMRWPTRVVPRPDGRSDYFFTLYREPGSSQAVFLGQAAELQKELEVLRHHFSKAA